MVFVVWDTTDPDWLLQTTWASDGESDFVPPDDDSLEPDEELDLDASYGYIDELGDVARRDHYQVISRHSWKESVVADIECQGFEIPEDERP
jgi:hypothetical protein